MRVKVVMFTGFFNLQDELFCKNRVRSDSVKSCTKVPHRSRNRSVLLYLSTGQRERIKKVIEQHGKIAAVLKNKQLTDHVPYATQMHGKYFLFSFEKLEKELVVVADVKLLGEGKFGEVYKMIPLTHQYFDENNGEYVLKVSKRRPETILREVKTLVEIHSENNQVGIQVPPYFTMQFGEKAGYLTDKFDDDLWDRYIETKTGIENSSDAHQCVNDLVIGLKNLFDKGYYHGDIKPENSAVKNGRYFLADMGGSVKMKNTVQLLNGAHYTIDYQPSDVAQKTMRIYLEHISNLIEGGYKDHAMDWLKKVTNRRDSLSVNNQQYLYLKSLFRRVNQLDEKKAVATPLGGVRPSKRLVDKMKENAIAHDIYALGKTLFLVIGGDLPSPSVKQKVKSLIGYEKYHTLAGMVSRGPEERIQAFQTMVDLVVEKDE